MFTTIFCSRGSDIGFVRPSFLAKAGNTSLLVAAPASAASGRPAWGGFFSGGGFLFFLGHNCRSDKLALQLIEIECRSGLLFCSTLRMAVIVPSEAPLALQYRSRLPSLVNAHADAGRLVGLRIDQHARSKHRSAFLSKPAPLRVLLAALHVLVDAVHAFDDELAACWA